MGWGRYFLLGNLGQQLDIEDQRAEIDRLRGLRYAEARAQKRNHDQQIEALHAEIDELKLYLAAAFRLLTAKGVMTTAEVKATVEAVDREDGAADHRLSGPIVPGA